MSCSTVKKLLLAKFGNLSRPRPGSKCKFGCGTPPTQSHILGGCRRHSGIYILRHDRAVVSMFRHLRKALPDCEIVLNGTKRVKGAIQSIPLRVFGPRLRRALHRTQQHNSQPDIVVIDHDRKSVHILEVGVSNWRRAPALTFSKAERYRHLQIAIQKGRSYSCSLESIIFGTLGQVPSRAVDLLSRLSRVPTTQAL